MSRDRIVDVVVVGSGAAGMAAAVTASTNGASVEVLEKASLLGGTSAWSGGEAWIPCNDLMAAAGKADSREAAITYIRSLANDRQADPELIEKFVDTGAEAIRYLAANSAYQPKIFEANADYYDTRPGFTYAGRSLAPEVLDAQKVLGDAWRTVRDSPHMPPFSDEEFASEWTKRNLPFHARSREDKEMTGSQANLKDVIGDRLATGIRYMGPALISGLLRGALDAGVTITTDSPVDRLIVEDGRVTGVVTKHGDNEITIGARRGVILASGGFEWNKDLTLAFLGVPDAFPLSPNTNTGDGLLMGLEAGAAVANMTNPAPIPAHWDGRRLEDGQPFGTPTATRTDPGVIIVNRNGRRFVNEGICYMDVYKAFRRYDEFTATYPNQTPVWQVFDHSTREGLWDIDPGPTPAWVSEAPTIAELATVIGVDPVALVEEVARWNGFVDDREDPDFHRGEIWWEGFMMGGPSPEKNMAKIENGPFYAMPLYNGIVSTLGGLRIDTDARVRHARGGVIGGLYAAGAVAAGIFGDAYPGPGGTLGPNLTFGYIAGKHAAANDSDPSA